MVIILPKVYLNVFAFYNILTLHLYYTRGNIMKKVLIITLNPIVYNGITNIVYNLINSTYKNVNYDLVITQNFDEQIVCDLEKKCHSVFICKYERSKKVFLYLKWLYQIMKTQKYDIVHIHANSATCFIELQLAYFCSIPVRIVHSHSSHGKYPFVHNLLKTPLNLITTHCLACSDLAGKWMFKKGYTLIYNAIDLDKFKYDSITRNELRSSMQINNRIVMGHVGYMDIEKNHRFIIDLFAELLKINKKYILLLIGDGKLRKEIEVQIDDYGISDSVILLGKRNDVNKLYQCMDIFLLPSLWEGFPISIIEAQTSGLPCVVSKNITKQVNITNNVGFLEIGNENINKWIKYIQKIDYSSEYRSRYYNILEHSKFDIKSLSKTILEIYNQN